MAPATLWPAAARPAYPENCGSGLRMQLLEEAQSAARALLCRDEISPGRSTAPAERVRELFHDTADSMN